MTREEVKAKLPIIQAFAEGKTIQVKSKDKWADLEEPDFRCSPDKYRIKPEPKYRPFKDREECWQEMQKHSDFGWVINIYTKRYSHITSVCSTMIILPDDFMCSYEMAFKRYKFLYGTPFGIKKE